VPGPVQESWQSIADHYHPPAWLTEGKFGIFIHFGLYSISAVNECYQKYI
jgi:alpha-L-fucosidase